jgi:putative transposase
MAFGHDEERVRAERARAIGLFRYSLIREAADGRLSTKQRGRIVRALAEREHAGPFGQPVRVSRATIDRWIRDWRRGGFDALVPTPRKAVPRTPADVLDLAVALKKEVPERTAAQIAAILRAHSGWSPDERTLQRNFVRLELTTRPGGQPPQAFGRFEAEAPNQRWTGVGSGSAAWPDRERPQGDPVRIPRRPQQAVHRLPVGQTRGHGAA